MWPELGYSSLLWKLGNIGSIDTLFRPATISWLLMLWSLWNSIVGVWCRDIYVAKQTRRGGIRAGHPHLWDHLGVSSWRMKSRCLTFTLASRLVNKHICDLHHTESYITFQPGSFCVPTFGGQCRPWTPIWRQIWNPIYRRTTSTEVNVKSASPLVVPCKRGWEPHLKSTLQKRNRAPGKNNSLSDFLTKDTIEVIPIFTPRGTLHLAVPLDACTGKMCPILYLLVF